MEIEDSENRHSQGRRIPGAVKADGEVVVESLWSLCSDFYGKLTAYTLRPDWVEEDKTIEQIHGLQWVLNLVMENLEERL